MHHFNLLKFEDYQCGQLSIFEQCIVSSLGNEVMFSGHRAYNNTTKHRNHIVFTNETIKLDYCCYRHYMHTIQFTKWHDRHDTKQYSYKERYQTGSHIQLSTGRVVCKYMTDLTQSCIVSEKDTKLDQIYNYLWDISHNPWRPSWKPQKNSDKKDKYFGHRWEILRRWRMLTFFSTGRFFSNLFNISLEQQN